MTTAKLFMIGGSQAVCLPRDCRMPGKEVYVRKVGNTVVLSPKNDPWETFRKSLDKFSPDFMEDRDQPKEQQKRELL
jgi:antitoxin VapB